MSSLCEMCELPAETICMKCSSGTYCSTECLDIGTEKHSLLCSSFKNFDIRPTPMHRRAIYSPANTKVPRFLWLLFDKHYVGGGEVWDSNEYLVRGNLLGPPDTATETLTIKYNLVLHRQLANPLTLSVRKTAWTDGSRPNESVKNVLDGTPRWPLELRGPMIAYSKHNDLDMTDFRHIIDILSSWKVSGTSTELRSARAGNFQSSRVQSEVPRSRDGRALSPILRDDTVLGIRINCLRDMVAGNRPTFEPYELPASHQSFTYTSHSQVSKRIGLPLITIKFQDTSSHGSKGPFVEKHFQNVNATALHMAIDLNNGDPHQRASWGSYLPEWNGQIGSVIIMRRDKKPLYPEHVHALCTYIRTKLWSLVQREKGVFGRSAQISKFDVLSEITMAKFAAYYDGWLSCRSDRRRLHANPYFITGGYGADRRVPIPFVEQVDTLRTPF